MNLNKLTFVLLFGVFLTFCSWSGCEKKEPLAEIREAKLVNEHKEIPQKPHVKLPTLAEQYPQVFPEIMLKDSILIANTKQYASSLLSKIGVSLDDVHLGIYLGKSEYTCFHHGDNACFVFILGSPEILWGDYDVDILPAPSYTEDHSGPGGMPLIVMPRYKSMLASELTLVHEFTHAEQDCTQEFLQREYESRIASYEYFKRVHPQVFSKLLIVTKGMYQGEFNEQLLRSCESFADKLGFPAIDRWALMQDFMIFVAMYDLEQKEQLDVATVNNLIFSVGAFYQHMSQAKTATL